MTRSPQALQWDVAIAAMLALSVALYVTGLKRLWKHAGAGRGVRAINVVAFALGIVTLVVALLSPLDALSDVLFSAHMGQHELLMLVAAPLLVMGKPWLTAAWALPERWRRRVLFRFQRPVPRQSWRAISGPVTILALHALALWIWHVPWLFEGAMEHENVHAVQHLSFFVTAALFWWALSQGRYGRVGYGAGVLFVFITAMHSGILGALITFAGRLWYPIYEGRARAAGVDPLEDQQLAGVLMWIPAGVILVVLGLAFLAAWLGESERRLRRTGAAAAVSGSGGGAVPPPSLTSLMLIAAALGLASAEGCVRRSSAELRAQASTASGGGEARRGPELIRAYGCNSCHRIPGVTGAQALVGPPLDELWQRSSLAGTLPNTPANLLRWLQHPQQHHPGSLMPEMNVTESDGRDIVAYLYTLR